MTEDSAVPAGSFGKLMRRNRCQDILRGLHFVANNSEPTRDKLRMLRPGVLPVTSKRNTTRMFMPDKPHRFEIYVGEVQVRENEVDAFDHKTGAAAVVRNRKVVLAHGRQKFHAVSVGRFYSSILAIELLSMNVYVVGTLMTDRLGYDRNIVAERKTRPSHIPRGSFTFLRSVTVPGMLASHWRDRKPVHYLCTGSVMAASMIHRNVMGTGPTMAPCPKAVNDYQAWMGGVDVHDQLRLQTFSIQSTARFVKYYKSLF
ncbi:hypothetical protein PHMEG_00023992 [Phytophthora megakarya]|uniref:PiggyBac transposable element-derived protein domain-containing protein n=1 Tax=Phytophthora megakarya TaxID=4795 RepID=A0A225VES7_9STRA|nr:hypothetical protein PHMEG_00023992 [Phytophthora megakarya]